MKMKFTDYSIDKVYAEYLEQVFSDKEFLNKVYAAEYQLQCFREDNPEIEFLYNGLLDRDLQTDIFRNPAFDYTKSEIKKIILNISTEYQVHPEIIDNYIATNTNDFSVTDKFRFGYDGVRQCVTIYVDPDITRSEFERIWPKIRDSWNKRKKQRRNTNLISQPKLLYAIHRARERGLSYSDISVLLEKKELRHCEHYCPANSTREDIMKIYQRFKKHLPNRTPKIYP